MIPRLFLLWCAFILGAKLPSLGDELRQGISLEYGRHQVERVLDDCPQLRDVAPAGGPIWNWLVAAFGDQRGGFQIRWTRDISPACQLVMAESSAYPQDGVSKLRVDARERFGPRAGQPRTPEAVLSGLVFELNNVRLGVEKKAIADQAAAATMDRARYIRACAREEWKADLATAEFYRSIWLPYCHARGLPTSPRAWYNAIPLSFEKWVSRFPPTFWYPWQFYGARYDRLYGKVSISNH